MPKGVRVQLPLSTPEWRRKEAVMAKYLWEAKPPLTRSDLFQDGWEFDVFHAENDQKAIEKVDRMFRRHDVGQPLTIRLSVEGRQVRTFKS